IRIASLVRIIQPEEYGTEREKDSERPPAADIDRGDQEQNARDQCADDGEAEKNEGDHPSFRATIVPRGNKERWLPSRRLKQTAVWRPPFLRRSRATYTIPLRKLSCFPASNSCVRS